MTGTHCSMGACVAGTGWTTLDDFENPSWPYSPWSYVAGGAMMGGTKTTCAHAGSYGLSDPDWFERTDVTIGAPGDVLSVWVQPGSGRFYMSFGATATGGYTIVLAPNTSSFEFMSNEPYSAYSDLMSVGETYTTGMWYRVEVTFNAGNMLVGKLYGSDGTTVISTINQTIAGLVPGGVAIRSFGGFCIDTIEYM
jgi:hypothetical protein